MSDLPSRRDFMKLLLQVPCTTALLNWSGLLLMSNQDKETPYNSEEHYYGMGVQISKCIGCGRCAEACKIENDVPDEPFFFKTWVERYLIYSDGKTHVDSPNGGINGYPSVGN